jgi:carbonic anhydrase/acetyltransferase-like protein (isoleucine patch superfamily)
MIRAFNGVTPKIPQSCFIEESAQIIGDVTLGEESSVWFNSVLRGDVNALRIGRRTNIQDLCMVHALKDRFGTTIGDDVTVGHHVVLHGCVVKDRVLVGMGAILMDGVEVGSDCVIAAGALLAPGLKVPDGSLVLGSPAKVKRPLTPEERAWILTSAKNYIGYAQEHRRSLSSNR